MVVPDASRQALADHARAEAPNESCGVLVLRDGVAERYVPGVNKADPRADYLVAVCAESIQGDAYLDDRFEITRDWVAADFFISTTNMNCDKVLQGKVIGTVERMGTVLAVVKDRRALQGQHRQPRRVPKHTQ